jgi:hypothetical protein
MTAISDEPEDVRLFLWRDGRRLRDAMLADPALFWKVVWILAARFLVLVAMFFLGRWSS